MHNTENGARKGHKHTGIFTSIKTSFTEVQPTIKLFTHERSEN
jgi:hypothetical protein